jgi:hypothetical protein
MANVPYNNLNYDGLKVVIVDPATGEFAVPNVVASNVTIVASTLPTGAATAAKQDEMIALLTTIAANTAP